MSLSPNRSDPTGDGCVVVFTMSDGRRDVRCRVQPGALDSVAGAGDDAHALDRFARHRALFERVASSLHDAGLPLCITADHVTILARSA